jgi:hypothetical protein
LAIEYLRFASGGSITKKPIHKNGGAQRHPQIFNLHYSIQRLFFVMILKIRQYLSANMLRPAAKVFAQSVDISLSGFGRQLSS